MSYLWESYEWPNFRYDESHIKSYVKKLQTEKLLTDSAFSVIDPETRKNLQAKVVSEDIIASLSIEGETIDVESLYSSVSKHLDVLYKGKSKDNEYASSIFSIVTDAIENSSPLTHERLFDWQKRLFLHKAGIKPRHLGEYRKGPEYVLRTSGKEADIIYTAVPPSLVYNEMEKFLAFVNCDNDMNPFIKAAIASLWFVSIHPFEDGNGRISRCIADYIIDRGTNDGFRTFSISSTILKKKEGVL